MARNTASHSGLNEELEGEAYIYHIVVLSFEPSDVELQ